MNPFTTNIIILFSSTLIVIIVSRFFYLKAKIANKRKDEFVNLAAHKLRTPLTRIKCATEELKENQDLKEKNKLLAAIEDANNRMFDLVNLLVDVSKEEAQKYLYKLESYQLKKIVKKVINNYQKQAKERELILSANFPEYLPEVKIDYERINSVIQIFIENAIHYSRSGAKIEIEIKQNEDSLIFSVKDDGIGISIKDQKRIFKKFFRGKLATAADTKGSGIGLYLAKHIIENHGGKIGFNSDGENKGSTFWFSLPIIN